uniref:Uncharacterized protein n=1 Tax=Cucumis sativus TaxID=3659 RepID=A0A0A0KIF0_CUCSA
MNASQYIYSQLIEFLRILHRLSKNVFSSPFLIIPFIIPTNQVHCSTHSLLLNVQIQRITKKLLPSFELKLNKRPNNGKSLLHTLFIVIKTTSFNRFYGRSKCL